MIFAGFRADRCEGAADLMRRSHLTERQIERSNVMDLTAAVQHPKTTSLSGRKKALFAGVMSVASLSIVLILSEIVLRCMGISPWKQRPEPGRPTINEPDRVLGWRNKEGSFLMPPYSPGAEAFQITNWSDGRRATAPAPLPTGKVLAVVGCSYTQGWAIADQETYPWKLHAQHPELSVDNYGTAGYGTYQCLLLLEHLFAGPARPTVEVYGLLDDHERRNVATADWLAGLSKYSHRDHVDVPFCGLSAAGLLERHQPQHYRTFPLHNYLSVVAFAERLYMKAVTRGRWAQMRPVTEALLLEMDRLCRANGVPLVIAILRADAEPVRAHYRAFCEAHHFLWLDCAVRLTADLRVQGDGHPNGKTNSLWAKQIDDFLQHSGLIDSSTPVRGKPLRQSQAGQRPSDTAVLRLAAWRQEPGMLDRNENEQ